MHLIKPSQSSQRPFFSATSALLKYIDQCCRAPDKGQGAGHVYFDLKAFFEKAPQLPLLRSQQRGLHVPPHAGPLAMKIVYPCSAVHGHLCSSYRPIRLEGHTTARISREFVCQPWPCASHWEARSTCCCMGERSEKCLVSCPGNPRCRGTGNHHWDNVVLL